MVAGKVSTHAVAICHRVPFWMPPPDPTMVPAIPPVTTCVVLTGNPVKPAPQSEWRFTVIKISSGHWIAKNRFRSKWKTRIIFVNWRASSAPA
jgi:hypothetical protein